MSSEFSIPFPVNNMKDIDLNYIPPTFVLISTFLAHFYYFFSDMAYSNAIIPNIVEGIANERKVISSY